MKKTYHSRQLEGILCVDKPQDWTSFDVVAKMRGSFLAAAPRPWS